MESMEAIKFINGGSPIHKSKFINEEVGGNEFDLISDWRMQQVD